MCLQLLFLTTLILVCATDNPLDALYRQCDPISRGGAAERGSAMVRRCTAALQQALETLRPRMSDGVQVDGEVVVLEPLWLGNASDTMEPPRWAVGDAQISGLSSLSVRQAALTTTRLGISVALEQLSLDLTLMARISFFRIQQQLNLDLHQCNITVRAGYSVVGGELRLSEPHVQLQVGHFNSTVGSGAGGRGLGSGLQAAINNHSADVVRFLTPSLEAELARQLEQLTQKQIIAALHWLQLALS